MEGDRQQNGAELVKAFILNGEQVYTIARYWETKEPIIYFYHYILSRGQFLMPIQSIYERNSKVRIGMLYAVQPTALVASLRAAISFVQLGAGGSPIY